MTKNNNCRKRIRDYIKNKQITPKELSNNLTCSYHSINDIFRKDDNITRIPSLQTLIEFSIKYKVSLDYLLCLSKNNQHQSKFKDFEDYIEHLKTILKTNKTSKTSKTSNNNNDNDNDSDNNSDKKYEKKEIIDIFKKYLNNIVYPNNKKIIINMNAINISKQTLDNQLNYAFIHLPSTNTIIEIANYLNVSVDYLFGLSDIKELK